MCDIQWPVSTLDVNMKPTYMISLCNKCKKNGVPHKESIRGDEHIGFYLHKCGTWHTQANYYTTLTVLLPMLVVCQNNSLGCGIKAACESSHNAVCRLGLLLNLQQTKPLCLGGIESPMYSQEAVRLSLCVSRWAGSQMSVYWVYSSLLYSLNSVWNNHCKP